MKFHCMKCQILFFGKNKKNITNLSSAEFAQRVMKVKVSKYVNTWQWLFYSDMDFDFDFFQ